MDDGVTLIAKERRRQIEVEGWTPAHDDEHDGGQLAEAATCYAATTRLYRQDKYAMGVRFVDPWSWPDRDSYDKRFACGERKEDGGNWPPDPSTYTPAERLDLLVKAGALLAAEIDRLLRLAAKETPHVD